MAFRADISINWPTSPRIVTVASPSTSVSIQDLVDTLRTHEAYIGNLDDKKIIDAYGKISLGGVLSTSVTLVLRNALLEFAARPPGPWVLCMVTGGNLVAKDINGVILPSAMQPSAYVYPIVALSTDGSLLEGSGVTAEECADAVLEAPVAGRPPGSLGASEVSIGQDVLDVIDQVADVADLVDDVHDEAMGKWVLNPATLTLTLYRVSGAVLRVFNLKMAVGDVPPYVERSPAP